MFPQRVIMRYFVDRIRAGKRKRATLRAPKLKQGATSASREKVCNESSGEDEEGGEEFIIEAPSLMLERVIFHRTDLGE
jgi:hypothetical protein